eukprot:CAMPEP_0185730704 /NCGR_PEP_ID=MMETSP1171-20130828/10738_1 /TAXON_ID=374046 /ORGANISM="Helicotheca tamensis, Strain CCMP826" /LENGTH=621 /DNA_ID=CAMNT_0028399815 /DNA_START=84 /DNA_END=1949 /DNA_ORIENTATION=-
MSTDKEEKTPAPQQVGDEPELVDENESDNGLPHAVQIVSIGTESDQYAFSFKEDNLNGVLAKVPPGWKVSVVSVVGAFRTGKSFLLSWFLRYLHYHSTNKPDLVTGSGKKWYEQFSSLGNDGFNWRGGAERNTTGIWMWSEPYFLKRTNPLSGKEEDIAVVLVDTQGMFDHETTMGLTAAIFGLSTLLSSYQIYNVDKRIQEDNLQQLALFSEYGRMALETEQQCAAEYREKKAREEEQQQQEEEVKTRSLDGGEKEKTKEDSPKKEDKKEKKPRPKLTKTKPRKPFQHIDFLVRDWQNFDEEEDMELMEKEMDEYLNSVIAERDAKDLHDTRAQITACFEKLGCFMFTHPGFAVTKKKYSGDVKVIEPTFLNLLDRYCQRVFNAGDNLDPKVIHGRELTAVELGAYVKAYALLFESGAHFPEAATMLDATAKANNSNATSLAIQAYKDDMDKIAGVMCSNYIPPDEFEKSHRQLAERSLEMFDDMANFGNREDIDKAREMVIKMLKDNHEVYSKLNDGRNPLAGFEIYILPMSVAIISFLLRWIADHTCTSWSQTCKVGSDVLSEVYTVGFLFMLIISATRAKQISDSVKRIRKALKAVSSDSGGSAVNTKGGGKGLKED